MFESLNEQKSTVTYYKTNLKICLLHRNEQGMLYKV